MSTSKTRMWYKTKSQEEFDECWAILEKNGWTRWDKSDWKFKDWPIIVVSTKPDMCEGCKVNGFKGPPSYNGPEAKTFNEVLKFLGIKKEKRTTLPDMWFLRITNETAKLLQSFDPNLKCWENGGEVGYENDKDPQFRWGHNLIQDNGWYKERGYKEVTLEEAILFLKSKKKPKESKSLTVSSKKRLVVVYNSDGTITVNKVYYKKI